jgi:hypothetical protein
MTTRVHDICEVMKSPSGLWLFLRKSKTYSAHGCSLLTDEVFALSISCEENLDVC